MKRLMGILIAACCLTAVAQAEIKVACKPTCCGKDEGSKKTAESQEKPQILKEVDAKAIAKEIRKDAIEPCGCSSCCDSGASTTACDTGCAAAPSCCDSGCQSQACGKRCSKRTCSTSCGTGCGGCYTSTDLGLGRFLGCGGGASCCCPQCCPGWTAVGEVLFLSRSSAEGLTLITDQNTGDEMLNVKDFDFDFNGAPRLLIRHENACCIGFELGYMGLDSWNDVALRGGPISPTLVGPGGIPFPSSAPGTIFSAAYGSEFHSGEFNIRKRCDECVTWVAGMRIVDFSDTLVASTTAPTAREFYTIDADNHMFGFQFGFDAELINCDGQFHIDSIFRVGMLFNRADQTTRVPVFAGLPPGAPVANASASENHTTFLSEIGLRAVYELNDRVSIGSGYHLIWLDGIALAPDQIPATSLTGGATTLDTGGGLLLHGAAINMTVRF